MKKFDFDLISTVKRKLGLAISSVLLLVILLFLFISLYGSERVLKEVAREKLLLAEKHFQQNKSQDASALSSVLETLIEIENLKEIFLSGNRKALFEASSPIFKKIKEEYGITNFYFHTSEGDVFLRVHEDSSFGDKTDRLAFQKARESGSLTTGIELGKTNFALRAVSPYFKGEKIIGYLELGEELNKLTEETKKVTDSNLTFFVEKKYLNKENWGAASKNITGRDNWDDYQDFVITNSTIKNEEEARAQEMCFNPNLINNQIKKEETRFLGIYKNFNNYYGCGFFPLKDIEGNRIGIVLALNDLTKNHSLMRQNQILAFVTAIFVLILSFLATVFFTNKSIVAPLSSLNGYINELSKGNFEASPTLAFKKDEIGMLGKSISDMAQRLKRSQQVMEWNVTKRTKELSTQNESLEKTKLAMLNLLEDIEEEKSKIAEGKAKDEALLESIGDGIVVTNQDGVITLINDSAAKTLGYSAEEMMTKSVSEILKLVDENKKEIPANKNPMVLALATGKKTVSTPGTSYYYLRKDGSAFPVGISVTPFVWNQKIIGTVEVFRVITLEKSVDQAKTEFVSLASHQLRTPLSAISWYTEMLLAGDAGELSKEQKEYLNEVYSGNQRLIELVNALLNVSRIELGTFAVDPKPTDIREISSSVVKELQLQIKEKSLVIEERYASEIEPINLDPELIRAVFQNLLTNSVKYTPEKGKISIKIDRQENDLLVAISDTGYGIPKKDQKMIFSKMFRADNVKVKGSGGTGLGLYLIKSIIEQSADGKIWFESEEDKGTTFFFTLPLSGMKKKKGSKTLT